MLIRITEPDKSYISNFRQYLIDLGAKPTAVDEVLEVPEDFDHSMFHGIEKTSSTQPFAVEFKDVIDWLGSYTGDFYFYLSLKSQLKLKGSLSPAQIASVRKAIKRDQGIMESNIAVKPVIENNACHYSLKSGDIINVSRWLAKEVGEKAGLTRSHYTLEVVKVDAETDRAYKATLMLSGQRMGRCGICGLALTDPKSVTAGIGPICAEKVGVSFTEGSLEELKEQLRTTRTVNTWFPKSAIKEKVSK